jgi:quinolinate synthase
MASPAENRVPDLASLDLDEEIRRLKRERNAVILAHY